MTKYWKKCKIICSVRTLDYDKLNFSLLGNLENSFWKFQVVLLKVQLTDTIHQDSHTLQYVLCMIVFGYSVEDALKIWFANEWLVIKYCEELDRSIRSWFQNLSSSNAVVSIHSSFTAHYWLGTDTSVTWATLVNIHT